MVASPRKSRRRYRARRDEWERCPECNGARLVIFAPDKDGEQQPYICWCARHCGWREHHHKGQQQSDRALENA